ncbi:MAG: hypothetical protein NUV52_03520 [Candidatus Roizmanbacteria bacterium]|nr:hypothetical protein [Candidatus Roizmanbacteria bacterium]
MPPEVCTSTLYGNGVKTPVLRGEDGVDIDKISTGYSINGIGAIRGNQVLPLHMRNGDLRVDGTNELICHAEDHDGDSFAESVEVGDIKAFDGMITVPNSPWNTDALLMSHFRPVESMIDIPTEHRAYMLHITGGLLRCMMDDSGTAYTGNNNGLAGLIGNKGFQSVGIPHWQVLPGFSDLVTTDDIRCARSQFPWEDNGISGVVATRVAGELSDAFRLLNPASVSTDSMGMTVDLPGFQPEDIASQEFDWFLRGLFLTTHNHLREAFNDAYLFDMDGVIGYMMSKLRKERGFNQKEYDAFFQPKDLDQVQTHSGGLYRELMQQGTARKGPGWAWGLYCTPSGATLTTINGFHNGHMGPIQALGRDLNRSPIPLSPTAMSEKQERYLEYVKKVAA